MKRTKKAIIALSIFIISFLLTFFMGVGSLKTSAAISTTPTCTTYGSYEYDGTTHSGCPSSYFEVKMYGSSTSGIKTIYNDERTNWGYYTIKVFDKNIRNHVSFKLYRNNILYTSKTLSDTGDLILYSGTLADGEYRFEYVCNIGSLFSNKGLRCAVSTFSLVASSRALQRSS